MTVQAGWVGGMETLRGCFVQIPHLPGPQVLFCSEGQRTKGLLGSPDNQSGRLVQICSDCGGLASNQGGSWGHPPQGNEHLMKELE